MQKALHTEPHPLARGARRDDGTARGTRGRRRMPGRLNVFQIAMLEWRDMHPYNAVHAVRIDGVLDAGRICDAIDDTLARIGTTGYVLDRAHGRYAWLGGRAHAAFEVIDGGGDTAATLARTFERQLNAAFPRDGAYDPFRFFAVIDDGGFFLGIAYDHIVAGGDSIVALLNAIDDRYECNTPATPLALYPPTHGRLFIRHPLHVLRAVARFPALAASCRRTVRPRYRSLEDGYNAFSLFELGPADYRVLRDAAKRFGVTLNDTLIALLLLAQDALAPQRDRSKRRCELAVASIMNLREAHGDDVRRTFGQFLSSFRVSHVVPPGIALPDLARDVHRATARVKREKLFFTTLSAIAVDRLIGHFQTPSQRLGVYAKSYPVGAGVSTLNVKALWQSADERVPPYVRGVPTGPASPMVVAVTTTGDRLYAGVSYRTAAFTRETIDRIRDDIVSRIRTLQ